MSVIFDRGSSPPAAMKLQVAFAEEMLMQLQDGFARHAYFWSQHKYGPDTAFHSYLLTELVGSPLASRIWEQTSDLSIA